ncbi:MAG: cupin domain-containing protein [Steroidobacteraceae bacterium]|jgi:mannose-6-phosphate isomerase-like protein (cupin superfamily)
MNAGIRRVVTGHDEDGKAIIVSDGLPPVVFTIPQRPGYSASELWATDSTPASINQEGEPTLGPRRLEPPPNGTRFRIVVHPPEAAYIHTLDRAAAKAAFAAFGSEHASTHEDPASPHPLMHRTRTVDYGIVLSGEVYLVLDRQETLLRAGDVVIQRGTNHAWANRSSAPCTMAFILVDGAY